MARLDSVNDGDTHSAPSDIRDRLRSLETKIASLEGRGGGDNSRHDPIGGPGTRTEVTDETDDGHPTQLTNANTIPKVRKCNVVQFKNRFTDEDGRYAIEALYSGALLEQEMNEERRFRKLRSDNPSPSFSRSAKSKANVIRTANLANAKALEKAQSQETWIQRVRLQSPAILKILSNVQDESWSSRPRTYFRPFITMVHFHEDMKRALEDLEDRWGRVLDGLDAHSPATTLPDTPDPPDGVEEPVDNCPDALAAMRCYVKFIDEEIIPQYTQFDNLTAADDPNIRFSDLQYLFRVGELVHRDLGSNTSGISEARQGRISGKRLWRAFDIPTCDTRDYASLSDTHRHYGNGEECEDDGAFTLRAFYLEYTGEEFAVMPMDFKIMPFRGSRRIRSLPIYPVRFSHVDLDRYLQEAIALGDKVLTYLDTRYASFDAWTVTRTPKGEPVCDVTGEIEKRSSYINSDVMIDFIEAFQVCDKWKPVPTILRPETADPLTESDDFPILWWSSPDRTKLLAESSEVIPVRTGVTMRERNKFISTDPLLVKMAENAARGHLTTRQHLRPEDKVLIPGRVFAYVFQDRKFAQIDVQHVTPASGSRDALDSLRIADDIKQLIQGTVRGHLQMKAEERLHGRATGSLDFIRGKGSGLFILLHGVPGVGKTATAEAIAQTNGKPLFKISCGDLGLTPAEVETSLGSIFRLAESWGCILLMDEVDTFFSQRSKGDAAMTKNALVSVFLRILDYYSGILFMTTNRVGALDEAFRSRIHYNIHYPALSREQTMEIWAMNLARLRKIDGEHQGGAGRKKMVIDEEGIMGFAERCFEENERRRTAQWNGRQIRNAFQVVRALAYADAAAEAERLRQGDAAADVPAPRLGAEQFRIVDVLTYHFEEYNKAVHGGQSSGEMAMEMENRADSFEGPALGGNRGSRDEEGDGYEGRGRQGPLGARGSLRPPGSRAVPNFSPAPPRYQDRRLSPSRSGFEGGGDYVGLTSPNLRNGTPRVAVSDERNWARPVSPASPVCYANKSWRGSGDYARGLGVVERDETGVYEAEYGESRNEYGKRDRA